MLIQCPKCSFAGSAVEPTGLRKCLSCGRTWSEPVVYPQTPPFFSSAPQAAGGGRTGLLVVAGAIALILVGGIVFAVSAAGSSSTADYDPVAQHPEFFTPEPATPAAPANYRVSAKIGAHCEGGSPGARWYLHEYRNTGEGPIAFPKIVARLRDTSGASIRDIETTSNVYALPPGESAWLHTTLPKEAASAAFLIQPPERVSQHTPAVSRMKLGAFSHTPHPTMKGYTTLNGSVRNDGSRSVSSVLVQAVGFDANKRPCSYTLVYIDEKVLAPGASGRFSVLAGTWQVAAPESWEIHAWGVVEK